MGFLTPLFLLAAATVAVPLLLHLFHQQERNRVPFPALRYLQRTAREHARSIRFRQLLLLLLRIGALLLLVLAGARLYFGGSGGAHPPTALAIILDNSPSSGLVSGDERVLDRLRERALESLERAGPDDRIWVIRGGSPDEVAPPGGVAEARERVRATQVSGVRADLAATLERAAFLVRDAGLAQGEIHLLSDLQATALEGDTPLLLPPGIPVIALRPAPEPPANRGIGAVLVGGGLPPLAGERTQLSTTLTGEVDSILPVRLVLDDRVAAVAPAGGLLETGPFPSGWVHGYVETDPDALRADDRRYFAFRVRPAPRVARAGGELPFLDEALSVVVEGGRIIPADGMGVPDLLLAQTGAGIETVVRGTPVIVFPPADPTLLPALNRRLAGAGIPWRYEVGPDGETTPSGDGPPPFPTDGIRILRSYRITPTGSAPSGTAILALPEGDPWILSTQGERGQALLLASPIDPEWSSLPVSAAMLPFLEWLLLRGAAPGGSAGEGDLGGAEVLAGELLPVVQGADRLLLPDGTAVPAPGNAAPFRAALPGLHRYLQGDSLLALVAVNLDPEESLLAPAPVSLLRDRIGRPLVLVRDEEDWGDALFPDGDGPEAWRLLLWMALLALLIESLLAATGRRSPSRPTPSFPGV
jgi:hypothetical protein